ncbi:hypothetical protein SELMODRAFT_78322 [Selaginella moellendorffii]|uniref:Fiber protein Fb15 n=1 Tax=Selaginella moellendorffii TaxID=88036 RepID=D8QW09_SELML|nr:hypothetical protein SELMODRAFT_78322 [Selaginella moellendorffii]
MAARQWLRQMSSMKVKDVPGYVKENVTPANIKKASRTLMDEYYDKYIQTSSFTPVYHFLIGGTIFAYIVAYPTEIRHYQHEEEERLRKLREGGGGGSKGGH